MKAIRPSTRTRPQGARLVRAAVGLVALVAAIGLGRYVTERLRAAAVLMRAAGHTRGLGAWFDGPVRIERVALPGRGGASTGRLYHPADGGSGRALVLIHGAQHEGIDAPAVVTMATSMAAAGALVITPGVEGLRDGAQGTDADAEEIGAWIRFAAMLPGARPGGACVLGASMAGGLALSTAARADTRPFTACVVAVGAYNDLERVLRFDLSGGAGTSVRPDPYALWVFAHAYADRLVDPRDAREFAAAADALVRWEPGEARTHAAMLGTEARAQFDALARGDGRALAPQWSPALDALRGELRAASPSGRMNGLRGMRVYLLHGANDDLIPPSEAEANARELRGVARVRLVLTPALRHVAFEPGSSPADQWPLVDVLARVLAVR